MLLIVLFSALFYAAASPLDELRADVEDIEFKSEGGGIVGLIVEGDVVTSFSTRPQFSAQTPFEIGSVSKVFTGLLLSVALEEERVGLNDPIGPQLEASSWMKKSPHPDTAAITYQQLATHQSGLSRLPPTIEKAGPLKRLANFVDPYVKYGTKKLGKDMARVQPTANAEYAYSNFGMGLLGQLVGELFGLPYCDAIQEKVGQPLSLDSLQCEDPVDLATPHFQDVEWSPWHFQVLVGAGGLRANAEDLGRFLQHAMNPDDAEQLGPAISRSTTVHSPKMGLGWHRKERKDGVMWWHNGATMGSNSFIGYAPSAGLGVVLLKNEANPGDQELTKVGIKTLRRALKQAVKSDEASEAEGEPTKATPQAEE